MSQSTDQGTDAAPIKPVSSLRSHFEGLTITQPPADDRRAIPLSPKPVKAVEAPPLPGLRASFDLPRPLSPWAATGGASSPAGVQTPVRGSESPPRAASKRPVSMLNQPSPHVNVTPAVKIESPSSPPRTLFDRSASRSPERADGSAFIIARPVHSPQSSRTSSRPATPHGPPEELSAPGSSVDAPKDGGKGREARSPARAPPPPVNRADKPKIRSKPTVAMAPPLPPPPTNVLNPDDQVRRPSIEARRSPFSTPPSSDDNSPSHSPAPARRLQGRPPDVPPLSLPPSDGNRPPQNQKDARFAGFSSTPAPVERKDPRTLGFTAADPPRPTPSPGVPSRANTVSEKPSRDPRELGLASARPTPRHVSESIRPAPSPPPAAMPPPPRAPARDARQLGFSALRSAPVDVLDEEARPGLPPRKTVEPPPRPSNESKNQGRPAPGAAGLAGADRSTKPHAIQPISRAPTMPPDMKFPPPPKRTLYEGAPDPPAATGISRAQTFAADSPKRPPAPSYVEDSDDVEESGPEEQLVTRTDYPDTTSTNRRPPFLKGAVWEISTKSDSRLMEVCGQYLCTAGYVTRVFDMSTGEQIMSINHGETVKATAVAFKPAADLTQEGLRLWLGTSGGEIMEVDVLTHTILATNAAHNRREVVRILRDRSHLWSLDDDGRLFVWKADETGVPNLKYSHTAHKVPRGHSCSLAVDGNLWLATGKEVRIYQPGNEATFASAAKPMSQPGTGDITCGTHSNETPPKVYFGHNDGRVSIYSAKDCTALRNVKASDYKINGMAFVGDRLWAAFKTGMVYVYDTSTDPWKVKKDWRAHNGPATDVLLDPSTVWTLQRLQVATIGHDNYVRLWDAALEDDWIETEMQQRDVEYCSFREVRAAVVTWNVGASTPYDLRNDFIADAIHADDPPEILVFGFQEVVDLEDRAVTAKSILGFGKKKDPVKAEHHQSRVYREWRDYLSRVISRFSGAAYSYVELQTSSLIGLFQCVFVRQEERPQVRNLQAASVKLGLKGHYGNKGALLTRFVLDDSSLCFINCHLAAGQTHTSHRNNDVASILEAEALTPEPDQDSRSSLYVGGGDGTQILDHEVCILNGDLNYRIDAIPRDTVINMVKRNELAKLLERDQIMLSRRRISGFRLSPFTELPITFPPTYKYDVGTDNYDTSEKKRSPAWCDRLLYRGSGRVKQVEYRRHEVRTSDHRPVSGIFRIRVKTIDARSRQKVKDDCFNRFNLVHKRMAEKLSVAYLVFQLGVPEAEARKLIAAS